MYTSEISVLMKFSIDVVSYERGMWGGGVIYFIVNISKHKTKQQPNQDNINTERLM